MQTITHSSIRTAELVYPSVCHVLQQSPATLKLVIDDWDGELHSEAFSSAHHVTRGPADWPTKAVGSSRIVAWVSRLFVAASGAWGGGGFALRCATTASFWGGGENVHRGGHMELR